MLIQEIIAKKRDGGKLETGEIEVVVDAISDESMSDPQIAAFAMAVLLCGMDVGERVALTLAMRDSGRVMRWPELDGPVLDKHSSGGIGDKVSLILAPVLAACGAYVPMLSGRGLGHTGGTLDKLESIPGYKTAADSDLIERTLRIAGCAIIGQTDDLVPADRRLYHIRDVTATVESLPLIISSIVSKKLAAGPQALVMDIKVGNGAFMRTIEEARELAHGIVDVANGAGLKTTALITDMNQCLGRHAGNALEVFEAIEALKTGAIETRLDAVVKALAVELLALGGIESGAAVHRIERALESGAAAGHFARMVAALGGPDDLIDRPEGYLPRAAIQVPLPAPSDGYVSRIDTRALGLAVIELGGGRKIASDGIDHAVGLADIIGLGAWVGKGEPLLMIHANSRTATEAAARTLGDAIGLDHRRPAVGPAVIERIAA